MIFFNCNNFGHEHLQHTKQTNSPRRVFPPICIFDPRQFDSISSEMFASPYHQVSSRCSRSSVPRIVYEYMYVLTFPACIRFISAVCVYIAQHRICQAEIIRMNRGKQQKLQIPPPSSDEVRYLVEAKLLGQDTTIHSKVHCTIHMHVGKTQQLYSLHK